MSGPGYKNSGLLFLSIGVIGILAVVTLLLFFAGLFQNIPSLAFMGRFNDTLNVLAGILAGVLACVLHPMVHKDWPRPSILLLIAVWAGALAISYGSWLIIRGRSDVELSSYYYFFGNGLIGVWVWGLSQLARREGTWPSSLTRWGLFSGGLMMMGLWGLIGILAGRDGSGYSPLALVSGLSFLGIGILYPLWCLRMGRWMLSRPVQAAVPLEE